MNLGSYEQFKSHFKLQSGIDLNCYKPAQMQRRIDQFIMIKGCKTYLSFTHSLKTDSQLLAEFLQHLTINVSQFFRDYTQWQMLAERILPILVQGRNFLKIWSAGCSSGQEAYTLALLLQERFSGVNYSIIGTDLDEQVLKQAKSGYYKAIDLQEVPTSLRDKYFVQTDNGYKIMDILKRRVFFQRHNLLNDPFDFGYDLIICRNVVIYFTEETKNILYRHFAEALRPGGFLFTGSTEQIFNQQVLGLTSDAPFFYQKPIYAKY